MENVLDRVFAPIARLAVAQGARFADVAERLRMATFVQARAVAGDAATDSRLAVMTGLQRRDIARLRGGEGPKLAERPDPLARLVSLWLADTAYLGAPLRRHGAAPSFDALAREVRRDVHPKSLLDALLAAGTVTVEGETVVLQARAYVPHAGSAPQLAWMAANCADHLAAAVGNVIEGAGNFEQAVAYDGLSAQDVAALEQMWRTGVTQVMQEVNARALALQDGPHDDAGRRCRFRAGAYFFQEETS